MAGFRKNDIISLIGKTPRYDLGESVGPDLRLSDVLDRSALPSLDDLALGYSTAQGDPRLRALIAGAHAVSADEAVAVSPMFPLARNTLDAVGAEIRTVPVSFDGDYQLDPADVSRCLSER